MCSNDVPGTIKYAGEAVTGAAIKTYLCPADTTGAGNYQDTTPYMKGNGRPNGTLAGMTNYHGAGGSMNGRLRGAR